MQHRRHRLDGNCAGLADFARSLGAQVKSLTQTGDGVPDLLVFHPHCGLRLVEVKMPRGRLRDSQVEFARQFPVYLAATFADMQAIILGDAKPWSYQAHLTRERKEQATRTARRKYRMSVW